VPLASLLLQPAWIFAALLLGAGIALPLPSAAESARLIPPPMLDETGNPGPTSEVAILAGGCFWGVQGVFQHVEGVLSAVSGYAGGTANTAHYEMVGTNTTGHAESVRVTFDPRLISYGRILQIYFSVAHDPTELNRQGPDVGTQYRSAIFPFNPGCTMAADTKARVSRMNTPNIDGNSRSALAACGTRASTRRRSSGAVQHDATAAGALEPTPYRFEAGAQSSRGCRGTCAPHDQLREAAATNTGVAR
jgi:methionine-S-sulfoxide reductase